LQPVPKTSWEKRVTRQAQRLWNSYQGWVIGAVAALALGAIAGITYKRMTRSER
jgi:hypothetical protein